jgi:hypothetical protein
VSITFDDFVAWAYGLTNALRVASYAPQIWRVARDRHGAQAISCLSWNLWTAANATTALYAWTRLDDVALTLVNAANALCCTAVVLITLVKRARLRAMVQAMSSASFSCTPSNSASRASCASSRLSSSQSDWSDLIVL